MYVTLLIVLLITVPAVWWLLSLEPRNSREAPVGKEEVLAARGVRWPEHLVHQEALAAELRAARLRRPVEARPAAARRQILTRAGA